MQWNELWGSGNKKIQAAERNSLEKANESIDLARNLEKDFINEYAGQIEQGQNDFNDLYNQTGNLINNNIPEYKQMSLGGMADLYSQMGNQMYRPEFQRYQQSQYNDGGAQNTDQYAQLMAASQEAGGDIGGSLANQYTYDIDQRELENQLMSNQLGQQSNQYLNQQNQNMLNQGMGLENYQYQLNQNNFANEVAAYNAKQQQYKDAMSQYNWLNKIGLGAQNANNDYQTEGVGSRINSLSGEANANMNEMSAKMQAESQIFGDIMSTAGTVASKLLP